MVRLSGLVRFSGTLSQPQRAFSSAGTGSCVLGHAPGSNVAAASGEETATHAMPIASIPGANAHGTRIANLPPLSRAHHSDALAQSNRIATMTYGGCESGAD